MKKVFLILACISLFVPGQGSAQEKPSWIFTLPKAVNNTYIYACENAIASSEKDARNQALARMFQSTAMRLGVPFESQKVFEAVQQGEDLTTLSRQYNIPIYKVCEHTERIGENYKVYVLCQVAAQGNTPPQFDYSFRGCNENRQYNNWMALAKSAVIPGTGQMGKRRYAEGALTLIGEAALAGGALYTYQLGQDKLTLLSNGTLDYSDYTSTQTSYRNLHTCNTVLWSAAAALYAYNLYRAFSTTPRYGKTLALAPSLISTPDKLYPSFAFSLKF